MEQGRKEKGRAPEEDGALAAVEPGREMQAVKDEGEAEARAKAKVDLKVKAADVDVDAAETCKAASACRRDAGPEGGQAVTQAVVARRPSRRP